MCLQLSTVVYELINYMLFLFFLAEDPSENYVKLRDFVLVKLCQDLLCFSPGKLMQGFSQEMVMEAQQKLKINKVLNQNSCSWTCYSTSLIRIF